MYSVLDFGYMAMCSVRMDAYARAIARTVKPDSVVLDIGAGTGIFSLLAARAGARRVHAVDPNPAVWLLPEVAAENGLADRIVIHPIESFDLVLDDRVDVIVSDLRGSIPFHGNNLPALHDAKARLLKPGGAILPARDRMMVAAVEAKDLGGALARAADGFERYGFTAKSTLRSIVNTPTSERGRTVYSNDVLTTSAAWAELEYGVTTGGTTGKVVLHARRGGAAHGLAIWFDTTIHGDLGFETGPGSHLVYSRYFLPFPAPIELTEGDEVLVVLRTDANGDRWGWDTRVTSGGTTRAALRQSSFLGRPTSPASLLRESSSFTPTLSRKGARLRRIFELMDGTRTVEAIVAAVAADDPTVRRDALLEEVRDASSRYAE